MGNIYKYRIKTILGDKGNMFWTLLFPILLATLFYFTFGSLMTESSEFESVPVAVVEESGNAYFMETLEEEELAKGDSPMLEIQKVDREQAEALLENEDVAGIYEIAEEPALMVKNQGIGQSLLKTVLDSYLQIESTVTNIAMRDPSQVAGTIAELAQPDGVIEHITLGNGDYNFWRENFYALIAMTCLYTSFFGLRGATDMQPGMSVIGARRSITPTPKLTMVLSDMLATVTVMSAILAILLLFLVCVLGIDMGNNVPAIALTTFCGVFVGVMLGMFIGLVLKTKQGVKDGILVSLSLVLSFLSGLMYPNMRFLVENAAPIVNKLNPAALMVDSFYTLDTYGMGERFWLNIIILVVIGGLLCAGSAAVLRRKQYASI